MSDDNKCAKCGKYSNGGTTCGKCQKESLKSVKKPKPKARKAGAAPRLGLSPSKAKMVETALRLRMEACLDNEEGAQANRWARVLNAFRWAMEGGQ